MNWLKSNWKTAAIVAAVAYMLHDRLKGVAVINKLPQI